MVNDLLYAELCQEIAEAGREEFQPNITDSKTLNNLSITHEKIKHEVQFLNSSN